MVLSDKTEDNLVAATPSVAVETVVEEGDFLSGMSFDLATNHAQKPYVPFVKGDKDAPPWANAALEATLDNGGYIGLAAESVGLTRGQVYMAGHNFPEFQKALSQIKAYWDWVHLEGLEKVSLTQANKAGCTTERFFQMKALLPW